MKKKGPVLGGIRVDPSIDENRGFLPFLRFTSFTRSAANAPVRARRQAAAFIAYVAAQQQVNDVRPHNRVVLEVVSGPSPPFVVLPRKITLPIVVFLAMLVVTGGLILALENARRRGRSRDDDLGSGQRAPLEALKSPPEDDETPARDPRPEPVPPARVTAPPAGARSAPMRTLRSGHGAGADVERRGADVESRDGRQAEVVLPDAALHARSSLGPPRG